MRVRAERRDEKVRPPIELLARRERPLQAPVAPSSQGEAASVERAALLQHDVDDREHRAGTVEGGAGASHDLDVVHDVELDRKLGAEQGGTVHVLVGGVAVEQEEDPVVVVGRPAESPHAGVRVVAVVAHEEPAHRHESVGERPVSVALDVLRGDDRDRSGRLPRRLVVLGGAADLDVEQLVERRARRGRVRRLSRRLRGQQAESGEEDRAGGAQES